MTNALTTLSGLNLPTTTFAQDAKAIGEMSKAGFLPGIKVSTFMTQEVKDEKVKAGRLFYAKAKDGPITDMGDEIEAVVLSLRATAYDKPAGVRTHDHNSAAFKDIADRSTVKDSGCIFGPEFLLWIPEHGFVTFWFNNKTLRGSTKEVEGYLLKPITIKTRIIKDKKNSWHGITVTACSSFTATPPDVATIQAEVNKFVNPKTAEAVESAPAATGRKR